MTPVPWSPEETWIVLLWSFISAIFRWISFLHKMCGRILLFVDESTCRESSCGRNFRIPLPLSNLIDCTFYDVCLAEPITLIHVVYLASFDQKITPQTDDFHSRCRYEERSNRYSRNLLNLHCSMWTFPSILNCLTSICLADRNHVIRDEKEKRNEKKKASYATKFVSLLANHYYEGPSKLSACEYRCSLCY